MWIDWFSGYIGIMIEHQLAHGTEHYELSEYLFCVNFQTTVGFRVIHSFHFLHLWVRRTVNYIANCEKFRFVTFTICFSGWSNTFFTL